MAEEERDGTPEGWQVRQRPALIAAILLPLVLVAMLTGAGIAYTRYLRPAVRPPITSFPAPGLETFVHEGIAEPPMPAVRTRPDRRIEAAKRAVLRDGVPGWERRS